MNKFMLIGALLLLLQITYVNANCMQLAQDFKCTYMHLQCTDNHNGECSCEDGSTCRWKDGIGDDNCPCGGAKPRRRRRRVHDGL
ncbi:unnamed protein product [Paramecium sonneborni]|uniref:Uncharacterized protein n=1 Tax=Paramecium sonneborni TaxID=65129 RepID=A0A8S1NTD4_9CILI|nr:unnamed protein product [Paramecium sonneborni]